MWTIIFGIISTILTIINILQRKKNKKLEDNRQQIHNNAQTIIQTNYFDNLPGDIREKLLGISMASASSTRIQSAITIKQEAEGK